jgi:hypothetical protein
LLICSESMVTHDYLSEDGEQKHGIVEKRGDKK